MNMESIMVGEKKAQFGAFICVDLSVWENLGRGMRKMVGSCVEVEGQS
jgi:hypothetical protein